MPEKENRQKDANSKNETRRHLDETQIAWHPAFVVALEQELERYKDALEFDVEHHLTTESLRIDLVVIKKLKEITISKNIAAIFRTHNLLEYKSPDAYVSIHDFNKGYGYVCIYSALNKVPLTDITLTFVESHQPTKLIAYLKEERGWAVEKKSAGIYIITGDIVRIQIIDSRELSEAENLWLKNLDNGLDTQRMRRMAEEASRYSEPDRIAAYFDAIAMANPKTLKEVYKMSKSTLTLDQVLIDVGLAAKWEARGEVRGEARGEVEKALKIAKNMLKRGTRPEIVSEDTGLPLAKVKALLKSTTKTKLTA